jgi:hypothetical protein
MTANSFPEEFKVDTAEARPLEPQEALNQLESLWEDLRGLLDRRSRDWYRGTEDAEKQERQQRAFLQLTVGIVDELGNLVEGARRHVGAGDSDVDKSSDSKAEDARAWLGAFARLQSLAVDRLEKRDVHRVPLLGKDHRSLVFEGKLVKGWVDVLNRPGEGPPIIQEERHGLWVTRENGQLVLIQRGQVVV